MEQELAQGVKELSSISQQIETLFTAYGFKVLGAILILILGKAIANLCHNFVKRMMTAKKSDTTLIAFSSNLARVIIMVFAILAALNQLGIATASLVAVIGTAGLAVGLALQGSLSNFAAGLLLMIFRPFQINDTILAAGVNGIVEDINILTTQLRTGDNRVIIIPNSKLTADSVTNFSTKSTRRIDLNCTVAADISIDKIRKVLGALCEAEKRIQKDPKPSITLTSVADSKMNVTLKVWTTTAEHGNLTSDLIVQIKQVFDKERMELINLQ